MFWGLTFVGMGCGKPYALKPANIYIYIYILYQQQMHVISTLLNTGCCLCAENSEQSPLASPVCSFVVSRGLCVGFIPFFALPQNVFFRVSKSAGHQGVVKHLCGHDAGDVFQAEGWFRLKSHENPKRAAQSKSHPKGRKYAGGMRQKQGRIPQKKKRKKNI